MKISGKLKRKWPWSVLGCCSALSCKYFEKYLEVSIRIAGLRVKI
jgi:hypothetical protein